MSIHLRRRQQGDGKVSLYFEYYYGTSTSASGKPTQIRDYVYPGIFLNAQPKTKAEKDRNKELESLAKTIKAQMEVDLKKSQFGYKQAKGKGIQLLEYFNDQLNSRKESAGNFGNWRGALKHLTDYVTKHYYPALPLEAVDAGFMEGYKAYLTSTAKTTALNPLTSSSQNSYFAKLKACLKQAVKDDLLLRNPAEGVSLPRIVSTQRSYLTHEELQQLAKTECHYDVLKRAFLFSCLTGLRWSDIHKLLWKEVEVLGDGWRIVFRQKKTKGLQYLDISEQARSLLGEQRGADDRVFAGLSYSTSMNYALHQWMLRAGITKHITFHCARHTFATLQIYYGTDFFTLSKMLGHSELKTTMIYAQIIDSKRLEAANRIPLLPL
ncbi:site-specific integrase [Candidatus Roizmanbacteria bacterium]|nr:site-specific integrase [Candidatus Roizmanbacteria bacterium]